MNSKAKDILFFDGICNLCNFTIRFVHKRDKKSQFLFESLQSDEAQQVLSPFGIDGNELTSLVLVKDNQAYTKSSAALMVAGELGFPYTLLKALMLIPKSIRDFVYDFIAKNRYKWFGKTDYCEYDPNFKKKMYGANTN